VVVQMPVSRGTTTNTSDGTDASVSGNNNKHWWWYRFQFLGAQQQTLVMVQMPVSRGTTTNTGGGTGASVSGHNNKQRRILNRLPPVLMYSLPLAEAYQYQTL
jgi:hypothetical protein